MRESHITLCHEQKRPEVFRFVEESYARLKKLCTTEKIASSGDRRPVEALAHLQRTLFGEPNNRISAAGALSIIPCPDPYREVETVAREIERIRREYGFRYGDFVVIFRDVSPYLRAIMEIFSDRRVPFFLAAPVRADEEPFIRAVVSALRLLKGEFRRESVLAVFKNSYFHADTDVAAAVENYADELGLWDEEYFRQTWTQAAETAHDAAPLNEYKTGFLEVLDRLRTEAAGISSAEEFRRLVYRAIRELGFLSPPQNSGGQRGCPPTAEAVQSPSLSSEYRSLTALARVLDTMCEYAGLAAWPGADYGVLTDMLERGLVWTPIPSSPRGADSVRVVAIVGGPPPASPVVFVCGLCERSFPREIVGEPFFKDRERRLVNRGGKIILDERSPLSSGERFFFYFAVSRATRRLVLTYPTADGAGKELTRSHYVEEVVRLFSDSTDATEAEAPVVSVAPEFATIADANELRAFVACQMARPLREMEEDRDERPTLAALTYNELLKLGGFRPDVYRVSPEKLSRESGHGQENAGVYFTSVSELETFGRCPFRHFCEFRLRLKELRRYEFGHAEEGMLYHEILARLYREIYLASGESRGGRDEAHPGSPGGIENLPAGYSRLFRPRRMQVRRRALHARIRDFLLKEVENERANATRPTYFELSFGKGKSQENADRRSIRASLTLRGTGPSIRISGRMDRVDVFTKGEEKFGVVVDYKRSALPSRLDLKSGAILQPGIYMLALKELFGLQPAGAFYYAISSGRKRGVFAMEDEESISGQGDLSRADRVSYEEIGELTELNARQATEYVQRILEGEKAIRPADRNECRTCPFSSVCRISEQTR